MDDKLDGGNTETKHQMAMVLARRREDATARHMRH